MAVLNPSSRLPFSRSAAPRHSPLARLSPALAARPPLARRSAPSLSIRASALPFPPGKAKFHRELEVAVDIVARACTLCVDVKKSLMSSSGRIIEKNDQSLVTIADFSVQALISLELARLFPDIPLVAEEDSGFLRSDTSDGGAGNFLLDTVLSTVAGRVGVGGDEDLTSDDVLSAIDRGGSAAATFDSKPATYWVLDPIDGTKGFVKGDGALYVVGLALVVEGEVMLGVMGCPNWKNDLLSTEKSGDEIGISDLGVIMIAHEKCGTWTKRLSNVIGYPLRPGGWERCFVDSSYLVQEARFCLSDSQAWEAILLSILFSATIDPKGVNNEQEIHLVRTCCGSLVKYLMVASGRASVFILQIKAKTTIKVWDHAIGAVCVHEAGGQVTDWRGSQLDIAADQVARRNIFPYVGVLVTNGLFSMSSSSIALCVNPEDERHAMHSRLKRL